MASFDSVQHALLLAKVAKRIQDDEVMKLLKMILKATGKKGVPQGGVITPRTQSITSNSSVRPGWSAARGIENDTLPVLDVCLVRLYLYVRWLVPLPHKGRNVSISRVCCFSVAARFPKRFSDWRRHVPSPLVRRIGISSRLSS